MAYYIKKLDRRHTMTKHGFTHMIEWSNVMNLHSNPQNRKDFYAIYETANKILGNGWSRYFNYEAKWCSASNVTRIPPRIYFKDEKYITLVLISTKTPA